MVWLRPLLEKHYGVAGPEWEIENLYHTLIRVRRGAIRVDADELTYPVHIMVRYELEQQILDGSLPRVRADFPLRSVRVAWEGELEPPHDLPGVLHREFHEGSWRLILKEGAEPQALLPRLQAVGALTLFSANRPTLNEIFMAAVLRRRQGVPA